MKNLRPGSLPQGARFYRIEAVYFHGDAVVQLLRCMDCCSISMVYGSSVCGA